MDIKIILAEEQVVGIAKYLKDTIKVAVVSRDDVRRHIENIVDYTLQREPYSAYIEKKDPIDDTYPKLF